jgi:flagellar assembly protein FliH
MTGIKKTSAPYDAAALLQSHDTASLLAALLKKKDPAWADLTRIIKGKEKKAQDFPLQDAELPEFHMPGKERSLFNDDEKAVIALEAKKSTNEREIKSLKQRIVEAEKSSYQKGLAEGTQKGRAEGYAKAKSEMDERIRALQKQAQNVLQSLEKKKQAIFTESEQTVTNLIMALVRKIIAVETKTNPEVVSGVVKRALGFIGEKQNIYIKVNPEDVKKVKDELPLWVPINKALQQLNIEEDPRIQRGGCIISTDAGQVDARIETQLREMETIVSHVWEEEKNLEQ